MKNNPELKEEKFAMISRWQESGLTQKKFIETENISMNHFQYWLKRYKKQNEVPQTKGFIKLPLPEKAGHSENVFLEILCANGTRLRFFNAVEIAQLKKLIS